MSGSANMFVCWDDQFSVGVPAIDRQHQFLFGLIRELQEAMAEGRTSEMLAPAVHNLAVHARQHFACEEAYYRDR